MTTGKKKKGYKLFPRVSRLDTLAFLVLGVLVAVIYFPATQAGFVWDDFIITTLKAVRSLEGIWELWFEPGSAYRGEGALRESHYWPLLYTTFWLEHKLWGFSPAGYHIVNILIHFANTVLLWRLLVRLAVPGAWFVAAVFAAHPLHAESVAWIIARKDMLATLFCLASLLVWLRFVESPSRGRYAVAVLLFAAAMLSKSVVVVFPATLLILQWWKNGRITWGDLLRTAPFFLVGLAIAVGDLLFYQAKGPFSLDYSIAERILIAAHALWFYVGKLLWPVELAVIYPHWDVNVADPVGWLYVVTAAAVAAVFWFLRDRIGRGPLACALFFAIMLSPTLGFIDYRYMQYSFVADRYQYLGGIGVILLFVAAAACGAQRLPDLPRKAAKGAALALLVLLGAATWNHAAVYKDQVTLFRHVVSLNPQARNAHRILAIELRKQGKHEEALSFARIAVEKRPDSYKAHNTLGLVFLSLKRHDEAEKQFRRVLKINPHSAEAFLNLGVVFLKLKRHDEAEKQFRRVLKINPHYAKAFLNLGMVSGKQRRYEEAVKWYRTAVKEDPNYALSHAAMGDALFQLGRYEEAVSSMERALLLKPDLPMAPRLYSLMEQSLRKMGRHEEALSFARIAVEKRPDSHEAHNALGLMLSRLRRFDEAEKHFLQALELNPSYAPAFLNLGETFRKRKQYGEAVKWYRTAVKEDPNYALSHAAMGDALFQLGRYEEAVSSMERALLLKPDLPMAPRLYSLMGQSLRKMGRHEEAQRYLRRAKELAPEQK